MTLLIVFNDGTKRHVKDVLEYDYEGGGLFKYSTLNSQLKAYWAFVPANNIKYFGPEELWVEPEKEEEQKQEVNLNDILTRFELRKINTEYDNPFNEHFVYGFNDGLRVAKDTVRTLFKNKKSNEEQKPKVDFKAELDDLVKKINDEMCEEEELDDFDRGHNRALRIAKAIVDAKKERLYGKE